MEKRSELKKAKKQFFRHKLKRFFAVIVCLAFMTSLIAMADLSTRKMMMSKDDKYALGLALAEDHLLKVDIAGESFRLDISPAVTLKNAVVTRAREYRQQLSEYVESKVK